MFSRLKHQLPVFAPLAAGLLIITLLTILGGLWQYGQELVSQKAPQTSAATIRLVAAQQSSDKTGASSKDGKTAAKALITGSNSVGSSGPSTDPAIQNKPAGKTATSSTYAKTAGAPVSIISVSLNVNSQPKGKVKLPAGSNQCEVLSQALAEGVITYLDMRYDSSQSSYGIYVIDNIGDHDSVWWTYTVNGHSPPGCSHVPAHDGDSVNWQYIK